MGDIPPSDMRFQVLAVLDTASGMVLSVTKLFLEEAEPFHFACGWAAFSLLGELYRFALQAFHL